MKEKQTRREFLKKAGSFFALTGAFSVLSKEAIAGNTAQERKKPNVVLVMTDDQGYGDLGCHGNRVIQTPHLDQLYTQSVRFKNFHVSPVCTPTRASLMTGRNPVRVGAWGTTWGRSLLCRDEVTMAEVFADAGYETGFFGKWHLGDNYPFRPQDRGFKEVLMHGGGGVGQTPDFWGNDYFDDTYFHNGKPEKFTGYCTDVWFDSAMKFIEENKDRPFFVYLATNAPHGPYNVADEYAALYSDNPKVPNANFYGMITNFDENMGRLFAKLAELNLEDNTILIFLTDNGTSSGVQLDEHGKTSKGYNAGMRGKKGSYYDGGHRVPCFIRWPAGGLTGGVDIDQITAHIDLLPTLIELCSLKRPSDVKFDGISLAPLLTDQVESLPDRTVFVQYRQSTNPPIKWKAAVMTERWRLINGKELYDMKVEPSQKNNVADKHPEVVQKLRQSYQDWWDDISKRFNDYCYIIIGSDKENPSRLTCFDWHRDRVPWNQSHIRSGMEENGFWAVEIAREGQYEISLRRWPKEVDAPITAAIPNGNAISVSKARLEISDVDMTKEVSKEAKSVTFKVNLKAGKTKLKTWFTDEEGTSRGAYYVYVKREG